MSNSRKKSSSQDGGLTKAPVVDKRIIIAAGPKGSSGKSTILLNLIEWFLKLESKPTLAVFDPDQNHKTLTRALHPEAPGGLQPPHQFSSLDWRNTEARHVEIDRIVRVLCAPLEPDQVEADKPCITIMDGVANQMDDVLFWANEIQLFDNLAETLGFRITLLICVDDTDDTALAAKDTIERVGSKADYIIVRNLKHGGKTLSYDQAASRERVLNEYGGGEITFEGMTRDLKVLCEGTADKAADISNPCSLWQAAKCGDMITATRALTRWSELERQFRRCAHLLLTQDHYEKLLKSEHATTH